MTCAALTAGLFATALGTMALATMALGVTGCGSTAVLPASMKGLQPIKVEGRTAYMANMEFRIDGFDVKTTHRAFPSDRIDFVTTISDSTGWSSGPLRCVGGIEYVDNRQDLEKLFTEGHHSTSDLVMFCAGEDGHRFGLYDETPSKMSSGKVGGKIRFKTAAGKEYSGSIPKKSMMVRYITQVTLMADGKPAAVVETTGGHLTIVPGLDADTRRALAVEIGILMSLVDPRTRFGR